MKAQLHKRRSLAYLGSSREKRRFVTRRSSDHLVFLVSAYPLQNRKCIFACISEINSDLSTEHEGVRNPAGTAWPEDILQIGLEVERTLQQSQAVSQLQHGLVRLHSNIWI